MKRILYFLFLSLLLIACTAELEEKYNSLESRVSKLETVIDSDDFIRGATKYLKKD